MSENTYAAAGAVRAEGAGSAGQCASGPGNSYGQRAGELLQALYRSVTEDDVAAIGRAMIQKAKDGHFGAAKLIFAYVLGKPQRMEMEPAQREVDRGVQVPNRQTATAAEKERRQREGRQPTGKVSPLPNGVFDPAGDSVGLRIVPGGNSGVGRSGSGS